MFVYFKRQFYRTLYRSKPSIGFCFACLVAGIFVCMHKLNLKSSLNELELEAHLNPGKNSIKENESDGDGDESNETWDGEVAADEIVEKSGVKAVGRKPDIPSAQQNDTNGENVDEDTQVETENLQQKLKSAGIDSTIILFWNHNTNAAFKSHDPFNTVRDCGRLQCLLTTNMSHLQRAAGVVISGYPRQLENTKLPPERSPLQRFVFYSPEAPDKGLIDVYDKHEFNSNYFNWTMTYRSDSSIPVPYGGFTNRSQHDRMSDEYFWELIRKKKKQVAYWVSRCNTTEDRMYRLLYAKELQQYINVDIYGDCGPLKCASMFEAWKCSAMLKDDYKFYISFENSVCDEYVTEKFFGRINHMVIPIVLRGADAARVAPSPDSFIAADAFDSVQKLAEYMLKVDKDEQLLYKHLEWYKDIKMKPTDHWCELCHALNEDRPLSQVADLKAWIQKSSCHPGFAKNLLLDSKNP